jgi:hypothetical protein
VPAGMFSSTVTSKLDAVITGGVSSSSLQPTVSKLALTNEKNAALRHVKIFIGKCVLYFPKTMLS